MNNNNILRYLPLISQLGLMMVASIFVGFGLGYFLDNRFGTTPVWTIICLIAGILSGFYSVYKLILKEIEKDGRSNRT